MMHPNVYLKDGTQNMGYIPRQTPLKRKTRLRTVSLNRRKRSGKPGRTGIIRLYGKALTKLRLDCFDRDCFTCVDCARTVAWDEKDALEFDLPIGEMSHVKNKRMYGDTLENVVTRCRECHQKSHNCGGHPLRKMEQTDENTYDYKG
jgi:5-methylcytosine-specific restriction endonuclease McrA